MRLLHVLLPAIVVTACTTVTKASQVQNLPSPDGRHRVTVAITKGSTNQIYADIPVWMVTITDIHNQTLFVDKDSTMVAHLNVYWDWATDGTLWLYNSDNGMIHTYGIDGKSSQWQEVLLGSINSIDTSGMPQGLFAAIK